MLAGGADLLGTLCPRAEGQGALASAEGSTASAAGAHFKLLGSLGPVHSIEREATLCVTTLAQHNALMTPSTWISLRCASSGLQACLLRRL